MGNFYQDTIVGDPRLRRSSVTCPDQLSDRELAFLKLACSERTYYEIAREMYVSDRTVDGYRDSLFRKLDVGSRVGLVIYAVKNGIVQF